MFQFIVSPLIHDPLENKDYHRYLNDDAYDQDDGKRWVALKVCLMVEDNSA